jgi:hypothetical protein
VALTGSPARSASRRAASPRAAASVEALAAEVEQEAAGLAGESREAARVRREEFRDRPGGQPCRLRRKRISQGS